MVKLVGASALALTVMAAAAPSAQAAHRHSHAAHAGYHYYHRLARHYRGHGYATVRTEVRYGMFGQPAGTAFEQDPPRARLRMRAIEGAYASVDPSEGRYGERREAVERRYAVRGETTNRIADVQRVAVSGGRPGAWCGWYARGLVGSDPGPAYNLARNWAHWGHASGPGVGVMVVWPHHVGMITGQAANGQWIVKSGNDGGGMARERARSVSGAIAFRAS